MKIKKGTYHFKTIEQSDIEKLLNLEQLVWGEQGCTREMIVSRAQTFNEGQIIALNKSGDVIGYIGTQFVEDLSNSNRSWDQITDAGTIKNTHIPSGNYMFGISLTAHPDYPGVGTQLQLQAGVLGIKNKKQGCFLGSRVPRYHKAAANYSIEEWVYGKNKRSRDTEIRYYQRAGFQVVKVIPDYFPDPESLNYGALMLSPNPFKRLPFPSVWAKITQRYGIYLLK